MTKSFIKFCDETHCPTFKPKTNKTPTTLHPSSVLLKYVYIDLDLAHEDEALASSLKKQAAEKKFQFLFIIRKITLGRYIKCCFISFCS